MRNLYSRDTINSVYLAVEVLKCLGDDLHRLTDISTRLGLSKSTAHRLLKTLENSGMVSQNLQTRQYGFGYLLTKLASPLVLSHQELSNCAYEEMKRLSDTTGETAIIYGLIGKQIVCLEEVPSRNAIKFSTGKGTSIPTYVGSAGRVLLSKLRNEEIEKIVKNIHFKALASNTIIDKELFMQSIKNIRQQGYASSCSTYVEGAMGISIPIENYISPIALSVLGPENRIRPKMMLILPEMKRSANLISQNLLRRM